MNPNVKLTAYLKKYKLQFLVGPILKFIETLFELFTPTIMARIIDIATKGGATSELWTEGGLLLGLTVFGVFFAITAQYIAASASQSFGTDMRNRLFSHAQSLSLDAQEKFGASSLHTRMNSDILQVQHATAMFIRLVLRAPCIMIGAIVMAMLLDVKLALVFLAMSPLILLALYLVMKFSAPFYRKIQKHLDAATTVIRENLTGTRVVRAFSGEEKENAIFSETAGQVATLAKRVGKISVLLSPITFLIVNSAIITILWFGGVQVSLGEMSPGEIVAFTTYANLILLSLTAIANLTLAFTRAGTSWGRIKEVLECKPPEQVFTTVTLDTSAIEIKNLSFSYQKSEKPVLEDVNLTIKRGQVIGIIGGTGSGKSTLADILCALRTPTSGSVVIGETDITQTNPSELRKKIRLAPQKAVLFSGTVVENLTMGKADASLSDLKTALRTASANEFIDTENGGLEKTVARDGRNFSGGQKQRLNIARALIGEPDVLILDDSFSALDFSTEARVRKNILEQFKEKTLIIISQRVHSVRHADQILVLEHGRVDGIGTHDELLEKSTVYREIYFLQNKR